MTTSSLDPAPLDPALEGLLASGRLGVLATLRRDGRPQLSTITYGYDRQARQAIVSVTDGRAKTANLRRDPRAALHVSTPDGWGYVVADVVASLSPVAQQPDDPTVEALVGYYRALQGEHPDWDEYRAAMVADRRLVLTLAVERCYGWIRG